MLAWIFCLQMVVATVTLLGDIVRRQASFWVWHEYARQSERHGMGSALFSLYWYLLFYSALVVIPFSVLTAVATIRGVRRSSEASFDRWLISAWFAAAVFLFAEPIIEFVRHLDLDGWRFWLVLPWCGVGIMVFGAIRRQFANAKPSS